MTNADVARVLSRLATMLEIEGANPFRVRAYRESARVVEAQGEPVASLAHAEGALEELPGIGKDLAQKIRDIVTTGTTALYEEMRGKIPVEVVALTELQGLGPKRVKTLFETMGVRNRDDLESAARAGKLRELPGFGEKVEQNVLRALAAARQWSGRMLLGGAWPVAGALAAHVRAVPGVEQVELAGSFRRRRETVGDLDVVVSGGDAEAAMRAFVGHPEVAEVLLQGETKSSVRLRSGLQVDLRHVPQASFGAALLYFTGSKEHNIELRKIAIERGLTLNEYGLIRGEQAVAGRTEHEIYAALGLAWIPPELREATGEIELAREERLPELIEERDLLADLHMHTDRTDGRDSLETMVRAARARGYAYCAITDHSKSLAMARGFDEDRVRRSVEEVAEVRRRVPDIEVLHGLEVDILPDGSLDLTDEGLALLDWVIVSLHARLDQPGPEATQRVLRALEHPAVHALGHPTARLIGSRDGVAFDIERVLDRAAELGVAMEINAQPDRIDLRDTHARLARERGVPLVIDTDAHSVVQLDHMRFGVFAARRAGLTKKDVLNTLPLERFGAALRRPGAPGRAVAARPPAAEGRPQAAADGTSRKAQAGPRGKAAAGVEKATAKEADGARGQANPDRPAARAKTAARVKRVAARRRSGPKRAGGGPTSRAKAAAAGAGRGGKRR